MIVLSLCALLGAMAWVPAAHADVPTVTVNVTASGLGTPWRLGGACPGTSTPPCQGVVFQSGPGPYSMQLTPGLWGIGGWQADGSFTPLVPIGVSSGDVVSCSFVDGAGSCSGASGVPVDHRAIVDFASAGTGTPWGLAGACPEPVVLVGPTQCQGALLATSTGGGGFTMRLTAGSYAVGAVQSDNTLTDLLPIIAHDGDHISCAFVDGHGSCSPVGAPDTDGVPDAVENAGPNGGDGTHDGVLDSLEPNLTSLPSTAPGNPYVTIASPAGTTLTAVNVSDPATPPTNGVQLPVGVVSFEVHGVLPPGTADVTLYLPAGSAPTTVLKYVGGTWYDFSSSADIGTNSVTLHLKDGTFPGDADGAVNGTIVDPVAVGVSTFGGFLSPLENRPALNFAKAGSSVPVKFSLGGNYYGFGIFATGSPASQQVQCGGTTVIGTLVPISNPGASPLSYDAQSKTYSYVWKTDKSWGGTCRQLVLKFADGSTFTADLSFK